MRVTGELVLLQLWDAGGEIDVKKVEKIFGKSPELSGLRFERTAPEYINISPKPLAVELGTKKEKILGRQVPLRISARIYSVGAVALQMRVPFAVEMSELVGLAKPFEIGGRPARQYGEEIFKKIIGDIREALSDSYPREEIPEEYAVFCITKPTFNAAGFMADHKQLAAGILREEPVWKQLATDEVEGATRTHISYFADNLIITDWSAALILEPSGRYEDYLMAIELANLQLLELRTYDGLISTRIDRAYAELGRATRTRFLFRPYGKVAVDIAEMRAELTRYIEDTINITKFFGDYMLAKFYEQLETRLHIRDWYSGVTKKLATLADIYQMAVGHVDAQRNTILEAFIVLLIIFEIVLAISGVV